MKKKIITIATILILSACNNTSKDSVEKADSVNKAIQDSALNNNKPAVDVAGSAFLVRVADAGITESKITSFTSKKAVYQPVIDFADMLNKEHSGLNEKVKSLANKKKVVLPQSISDENQMEITLLEKSEGKELDKTFLNMIISKHITNIEMYEVAIEEVADYDIKTFAEKILPVLKSHLEVAKSLQKKYQ